MKRNFLFSCLYLAAFAFLAFPVFTEPVSAGVPADFGRIYTERIEPAQAYAVAVAGVKVAAARIVFSSFTMTTRARPGWSAGYRTRCPGFLIGDDPTRRPSYRALAVPWCRISGK